MVDLLRTLVAGLTVMTKSLKIQALSVLARILASRQVKVKRKSLPLDPDLESDFSSSPEHKDDRLTQTSSRCTLGPPGCSGDVIWSQSMTGPAHTGP